MITAITPTGGRPEALGLCDQYMQRQTCQDFRWVVLDDCDPQAYTPTRADKIIRPDWRWATGDNTQHKAMLELLKEPGPVVIIEDDDWYHPDWIRTCIEQLEHHELFGERHTLYYHVANRTWKRMNNAHHASLCATACRGSAKDILIAVCHAGARMIDHQLWRSHQGHLVDTDQVIGIKGLPGRPGIGVGHKMNNGKPDQDLGKLRGWIGNDVTAYEARH